MVSQSGWEFSTSCLEPIRESDDPSSAYPMSGEFEEGGLRDRLSDHQIVSIFRKG